MAEPSTRAVATPPARATDLGWVSWLRFAAITAVVLIHVGGLTAIAPDARSTSVGRLGIALDFGSRWAVPVFVMLSGALLLDPARYRSSADFLRRRALRLVPPTVFWHLVYLVVVLALRPAGHDAASLAQLVLTGKLWTALYFFWIVLGLAVVTPLLVPWVATTSRRGLLIAGLAAALVPVLTLITVPLRDAPLVWVETPWTWWVPYLGYYLLGFALRDVVLRHAGVPLVVGVAALGGVLMAWQWRRTEGLGASLERYLPAESYYSPVVLAVAVAVFLSVRALVRPDGRLRALTRPAAARLGRRLGDATLGVFAVHLLVLEVVLRLPWVGGAAAASSVPQLLARILLVLGAAYLVSLVAARIPLLRRVC